MSRFVIPLLFLVAFCFGHKRTPGDGTVVVTEEGPVKGSVREGFREFLGIPFAEAPVGPLRYLLGL
jgi:hypothetical protein